MFNDEIFRQRHDNDDQLIVEKFRAWCAGLRAAYALPLVLEYCEGGTPFDHAVDEVDAISDALFQLPAQGPRGLAIKAYVWLMENVVWPGNSFFDDDPRDQARDRCSLPDFYTKTVDPSPAQAITAALIADIARFAPDLAPLCAGIYSEPEPQSLSSTEAFRGSGSAPSDGLPARRERDTARRNEPLDDIVAPDGAPATAVQSRAIAIAQADLVAEGLTLAELIAAEKRAWDAQTVMLAEAELPWFAYHKKHPDAPCPWETSGDLSPELSRIAELHRRADKMTAAANALTDRVVRWIPTSFEDAIRLIEHDKDSVEVEHIYTGLLIWLRAVAGRETADTAAPLPEAAAVRLCREWLAAEERANEIGLARPDDDDPEFEAACQKANRIYDRVLRAPATDLPSLAAKVYLRLHEEHGNHERFDLQAATDAELALARDLSRILPNLLGPRLVAEPES